VHAPDIRVAPDAAELVHGAESADVYVIFHRYVPGQCCAVRKYSRASDDAIVGDVRIGHEKIVVPDARDAASARRATAHCAEFAEAIAIANDDFGVLAAEFQVLRIAAHRAERIENVFAPDAGGASHYGVRLQDAVFAKFDIVAH